MPTNNFSKHEILAFRQCPKRLWLEIKNPELREVPTSEQARRKASEELRQLAQKLYDPHHEGQIVVHGEDGMKGLMSRSKELLQSSAPIFRAGFSADGIDAHVDILLPSIRVGNRAWRLIHVRTSTIVREHHYADVAVQAYVAKRAGVDLVSASLSHVDSNWLYPGHLNYRGLLVESDMTAKAATMEADIKEWVAEAQKVMNFKNAPERSMGRHCHEPHPCSFQKHCRGQEKPAEFPVSWLPRAQPSPQANALRAHLDQPGNNDLRQVPNALLNDRQRRVKDHTLAGTVYFDRKGAAADLAPHPLPASFLAFESIQFSIPIWTNTRPFQPVPFQFSLHKFNGSGEPTHESFIDLTGNDPSLALAEALVAACGASGTIFGYNAAFEKSRIRELADRFPRLRNELLGISERIVDLLRVAEMRYYHPAQEGSWSLKKILPAIAPEMVFDRAHGIKDGAAAMRAYFEAIDPATPPARAKEIEGELVDYVRLDTLAMVKLWKVFSGNE